MTDQITYMDVAAATPAGLDYKRRSLAALDVRPGQTVVDIGCGPGTDLGRLAEAVGPDGLVIGIDRDPSMLAEARRRSDARVHEGDIHALPLADGSVDRARADRLLQHVSDPQAAIAEVRRVLRPGGLFGMAEPDWDTLAVADDDPGVSRAWSRFVAGRVRNPTIGRELPRLCARAGLEVRSVEPVAVVFHDFETADRILGLRRNTDRAVQAGALLAAVGDSWVRRQQSGPVLAGFTCYLVTASH
ncbi:methyltransferase domain-containing protein [Actinoplanes sp. CA-142083]|uniref:methyltransferase domain-containing protein n=1 Tax=Actinoplanes sp. CA-142083 TaxID=3239903 RepID=UPI003D915D5D